MPRFAFPLRPLVGLALALTLLAPLASAHGTHGFEQPKLVGDTYLTFGIDGPIPMANTPTEVTLRASNVNTGGDPGVESVSITLYDPSNATIELDTYAARGAFAANATFPVMGAWRANVTLHPSNTTVEFEFPVHAEGPYVWDSPNAATGLFAVNTEAEVEFLITEWRSQDRAPAPDDVTVRLEHWTEDHSTMLSRTELPTEPTAPGMVVMTHTFNASGMYHAYLASPTLGFGYDDRPYEHVYALSCEEAQQYDPEHTCARTSGLGTPGPGVAAGIVGVLVGALVIARRR